jgi:hypothetical protein
MRPDDADGAGEASDDHEPSRLAPEQIGFPVTPVHQPMGGRGLAMTGWLVALVVGLAFLKPWGPAGDQPTPGPPAVVAPANTAPTPRPTDDDTAEGLAGPICLGASGWRIASLERWRNHDVRVWRAIEPMVEASGPLDPRIPTAPLFGLEVEALGWCAPAYGPGRPVGPARVDGWIVIGGIAHELGLRQTLPSRGTTALAALYVPVAPCALGTSCSPAQTRSLIQRWDTGRVVFRYEDRGAAATVWFGAEVELSTPIEPGGTATPPPGP